MVGSEMDGGDRPRGIVRRRSFAKRQQQRGGSSSSSALAFNDGGGEASVVVGRCRKEKARGRRPKSGQSEVDSEAGVGGDCGTSEGDGGEPVQSPLAAATTTTPDSASMKRIRLDGKKPAEDCPASVPRKSRSARYKRSPKLESTRLLDSNRRKKHPQMPNPNGVKRVHHNMLRDSVTEDEKEVAEALFVLSGGVLMSQEVKLKEDKNKSLDNSTDAALSASVRKVSNDGDISLLRTFCETRDLRLFEEETVKENLKVEPTVFDKLFFNSRCHSVKPELNGEPDYCKATRPLNSVQPNGTSSTDAVRVSVSLGVSHHSFGNGGLQPAAHDAVKLNLCVPDSKLLPSASCESASTLQHEDQMLEQNSKGNIKSMSQKAYAPDMQAGLSTSAYEQLKISSSSRSAIWPALTTSFLKLGSNCTPEARVPAPVPLNATDSPKNCTIHVHLSHLIQDYQRKEREMENQQKLLLPADTLKSRGKSKLGDVAASETPKIRNNMSCMVSTASNGSFMGRNLLEVRNESSHNWMHLHAQKSPILPENFVQQKQRNCDFPSLPTSSEARTCNFLGSNVKPPMQTHSSFLFPQVSNHSTLPFHFSHPHVSQYQEKLSAATKPQVNFPVLPYIGSPFYVQQAAGAANNTNVQQHYQMWQAQIARCGLSMGVGVLQNGNGQPSLFQMRTQSSPSTSVVLQGLTYHPPNTQEQQQLLSKPPLSSSIRRHHEGHHDQSLGHRNGSELLQEGTSQSQVQMLCNVQRS